MNIIINGRFLSQKITGVQRVALNFAQELQDISTLYSPVPQNKDYPFFKKFRLIPSLKPYTLFWEQILLPFKIKKNDFLLNFGNTAPLFGVKNQAVMIHDTAFLYNPNWFSKNFVRYYRFLIPKIIQKSRFIMTVSEFSKSEIIQHFNVDPKKIIVLPLWLNEKFSAQARNTTQARNTSKLKQNILTVSSIEPRKNHQTLIDVFQKINTKLTLSIIGSMNNVFRETHLEQSHNIQYLGRCNDDELIQYYQESLFFVSLSLYEGFGLPPLEAMACGCPVLVSDIPAHREICQDAAYFVNPLNHEEIIHAINELSSNQSLREDLIQKGYQRVQGFSKTNSIQTLVTKLKEII